MLALSLLLFACGTTSDTANSAGGTTEPAATVPAATSTAAPSPSVNSQPTETPATAETPTAVPTDTPAPTQTSAAAPTKVPVPTSVPEPVFASSITGIDESVRQRIEPTSWRPGCPVGIEDLRLLSLSYWDYSGEVRQGELIVAATHAEAMVEAFGLLFDAQFPIERMELVDIFNGDDQASMQANNTSAFNCREVAYSPGVWSNHAFGTAIDINPLVNPYVAGSFVDPIQGAPYVDRDPLVPGLIVPGDPATDAFAQIGWIWGGDWQGVKDYQHFSANGR